MRKLILSALLLLTNCYHQNINHIPIGPCWVRVRPTGPGMGIAVAMHCTSLSEAEMMTYYVAQEACTKAGYIGSERISYQLQETDDDDEVNLTWSFRCVPSDLSSDLVPWPWQVSETYDCCN